MAKTTTLEEMVVRLTGESGEYTTMLKEAQKATAEYTRGIDGKLRDAQGRFLSGTKAIQAELQMANGLMAKTGVILKTLGAGYMKAAAGVQKMGAGVRRLGTQLSMGLTGPIVGFGALATREFSAFDHAMTESTSIITATSEEIASMRNMALGLAGSGQALQGPETLAKSYFFLASAGKNVEQQLALLPKVSAFATAGAFDMAQATSMLADTQAALGMSSADAAEDMRGMVRVSDVLVQANILSNASVQEFGEALTNSGAASLRAFNKDIEEGTAVLAAYAAQGIKGNVAGTNLSRVMLMLSSSTRANAKEHKELGFSVFDANGKMRNFADIVQNLETITAGMSDEMKSSTLDMLGFQAETQKSIVPLLGTSAAIRQYEKDLRAAGGLTQQVADKQLKSFSNQMQIMKNQVAVVAIEIGEVLAPVIIEINKYVAEGLNWWRALSPEIKVTIITVTGLVAALGPLLIILGTLVVSVGTVMGAIGTFVSIVVTATSAVIAFTVAIVALMTPAAAVVIGIAAISAAIFAMNIDWGAGVEAVKGWASKSLGYVKNFRENFGIATAWLGENWWNVMKDIASMAIATFKNAADNLEVVLQMMVRLTAAFTGFMTKMFWKVFSGDFVQAVIDGVKKAGELIAHFGDWVWENIKAAFSGEDGPDLKDFLKQMGGDFVAGAGDEDFMTVASNIMNEEKANLKSPLEGFQSTITAAPEFKEAVAQTAEAATEAAVPIAEASAIGAAVGDTVATAATATGPVNPAIAIMQGRSAPQSKGAFLDEDALQRKPREARVTGSGADTSGKDTKDEFLSRIATGIEKLVILTEKLARPADRSANFEA